jgi:tetratricopeptide (TPR) repeat protein
MIISIIVWSVLAMSNPADSTKPDFDAWWDYDHPDQTEVKFRELLPAAKATNDTGYYAELLTQIARTLGLQQKFDSAHAVLDEVKALLPGAGDRAHVRYLLERGRALNSSKKQAEAEPVFAEAWQQAEKAGLDFFAVDALHMLAIVASVEKQMEWNQKAAALAEKSTDQKARNWLASLYNNMGWTHFEKKAYDSALALFEKALPLRIARGQVSNIRFAKWCIAKTQRMLGRFDEALATQIALDKEWAEAGEPDGYVFEELGEIYLAKGDSAQAKPWFAKAYEFLSKDQWLSRDEPERLARMKQLGGLAE